MKLVSRKEALAVGLIRYFTGKPCKHGHISERVTKGRGCISCMRIFQKQCEVRAREAGKSWVLDRSRKSYARNPEKRKAASRAWRDKNKERCKLRIREWQKANKSVCAHHAMLRKSRQLQATPAWVDLEEIKGIYKNCPPGHHVDHIMPLVHKHICGLHVPWNLQYLPASENMSKGNRIV